ncbi:hypothetical protein [Ferruginibacter sp.]
MKNILRSAVFFSPLFIGILLFASCTKNKIEEKIITPPDGGTTCTATKAAAENIQIFPADNPWNKDISASAIDPYNTQIIAGISTPVIKADFGSGLWQGTPIGIPYIVVCGNQPKIPINFTDYGDESDPGPYPIPLSAPIEGNGSGDAHVIAVDVENKIICRDRSHLASSL